MLVQSLLIPVLVLVGEVAARRKQRSKYRPSTSTSPSTSSFTSSLTFSLSDGLPHRPTPVDGHLLDQIAQFRKDMYPSGPQEERELAHILTNKQTEEFPFRAPSTVVHWKPLECSVLDYDLRKVGAIHKGSRNSVYKLMDRRTGQLYAWKIFAKPDEYTAELFFFMVANHPLIVKPLCIMQEPHDGRAGLVMEYVEDGLHSRRYLEQNPEELVRISAQAYDVLKYMHWLGFIHADFKPENVLIDSDGNVKAIDFGFAIHMPRFKYYRGTPNTNAPELMRLLPKAPVLENIDWWAFGATVAQWHGSSTMAPIRLSRQEHHRWIMLRLSKSDGYYFGKVPHEFPEALREMLYYCWTPDPTMRQWNRKSQLVWFESLPFWDGVDFGSIGYKWASA